MNRRTFLFGASVAAAGVVAGARALARSGPPLEEQRLLLDAGLGLKTPLRLSLISDLHAGFFLEQERLQEAWASIRAFAPDLVLNAGDTVDRDPAAMGEVGWFFAELAAFAPTFAVLGNHDLRMDGRRVARRLASAVVRVLRNELALLAVRDLEVSVCGARDLTEERGPHASALRHVPAGVFSILLAHHPETLDQVDEDWNVGLLACGHSHGGQICLPGRVPVICKVARAFAPGLRRVRGRNVALTRGLGFAAVPVRLNCPPDVTHIEVI